VKKFKQEKIKREIEREMLDYSSLNERREVLSELYDNSGVV